MIERQVTDDLVRGAMSSPEPVTRATQNDRLADLPTTVRALLVETSALINAGRFADADLPLRGAIAIAPAHPETLRITGVGHYRQARYDEAIEVLRRASAAAPNDAPIVNDLGNALAGAQRMTEAIACWRRACMLDPGFAQAWSNLGRHLHGHGDIDGAIEALTKATTLAPGLHDARLVLGEALVQRGRIDDGVAKMREVLAQRPHTGQAWWALSNVKTTRLDPAELATLGAQLARSDLPEYDRIAMGFALGKANEDAGRYAEAFAYFSDANARMARRAPWNAAGFPAMIERITSAFAAPHAQAADPTFGHEAIFIVSMPRSGSTLIEQIVAAHPDVEGASELPYLGRIIAEESARRGRAFPDWVGVATAPDWRRMGERYLAMTARWRARKPRFTDKTPTNWMTVGAIRAMLPGARIVNVVRDRVETCWSCYKQLFAAGQTYTYDLGHLAVYWNTYERAMRRWLALHPTHLRRQGYEQLVAEAETQTRALLDFLGLPFDDACLRFDEGERSVRTPSAAQVRQPLRADTARAIRYGKLLAPLQRALGVADSPLPRG